jgi:hypothetical protein
MDFYNIIKEINQRSENDDKQTDENEESESISNVIHVNNIFKLPIHYNTSKMELKNNIITDLELINCVDSSNSSIYELVCNPSDIFGKKILEELTKYYTIDVKYLKDTQKLIKNFNKKIDKIEKIEETNTFENNIITLWDEIKNDTGFKQKYQYIDWKFAEELNYLDGFLQIMCIYNLSSPVLSLLMPIFILIVPFIVLHIQGKQITFNEYLSILKVVAANQSLFNIFFNFKDSNLNQKMYILISAGFYIFSIYQNILSCVKFFRNMINIHNKLLQIKLYISTSIHNMDDFLLQSSLFSSYDSFNEELSKKKIILEKLLMNLNQITPLCISVRKFFQIGYVLQQFYNIYGNKDYEEAFLYSFGFNGYISVLHGLIHNIRNDKLQFCKFISSSKKSNKQKTEFKNLYYPALINQKYVTNNCKLDKNLIITGPNASGKTTILKSVFINILFSQQFGLGTYSSAIIQPYKFLHSYLNIPDTSGRDSLFQAEARRCKEIIECIKENNNDRHFCIFDEIFTGTNPEEAIISAQAFMKYLNNNKNACFILTTHFLKLCKKFKNDSYIENYYMKTIENEKNLTYLYKISKGISTVKGGIKALNDMNYPSEIINSIQ